MANSDAELAIQFIISIALAILAAVVLETPKKRGIFEGTILAFITLGVGYLLKLNFVTIPNMSEYMPLVAELDAKPELAEH